MRRALTLKWSVIRTVRISRVGALLTWAVTIWAVRERAQLWVAPSATASTEYSPAGTRDCPSSFLPQQVTGAIAALVTAQTCRHPAVSEIRVPFGMTGMFSWPSLQRAW